MTSPTTSSSTSIVAQSALLEINALLSDQKWGGVTGTGAALTYSFPWTSFSTATFAGYNGGNYSTLDEQNASAHYGLNAAQQVAARNALQSWASVANIVFSETADTSSSVGDIRFAWTSVTQMAGAVTAWGWAGLPGVWPKAGDVWISTVASNTATNSWEAGSTNFESLLHESGHALGLKHPFEGAQVLPGRLDSALYTTMSYTLAPHNIYPSAGYIDGTYGWLSYYVTPETPMVLDIAAIQYLYGANTTYRNGDDTYTIDSARPFFKTIWDAGGTDTLSASNFTLPCVIDLTPGHYSSFAFAPPRETGGQIMTYDGTNNLGIAYDCFIENAIGGSGNDTLTGSDANNIIEGGGGSDMVEGGGGTDAALFTGNLADYTITKAGSLYTVRANTGTDGSDTVNNIESLKFADKTVNLTVQAIAAAAPAADVQRLTELYVAFFNRVPDADGLAYWIAQMSHGQSINQIADSFYNAGVQYSSLTGFSTSMSNADFVKVIYKNVLGRSGATAPPDADVSFWANNIATGADTRGSLINTMLGSAHTFKGNATWGWVADLLDNKITVANKFAVDWGLNFNTPAESISQGMAIAAAVTPTDTAAAIALIGVSPAELHLV